MSDETAKSGLSTEHSEFERQDLSAKGVFSFLVGLAIIGVIAHFILTGMYAYLGRYEREHQPPQNPLVKITEADTRLVSAEDVKKFPLPQLEVNERGQLNDRRLAEEKELNSYGWVDEKAGVVRIPIERAMQLVAERGLPVKSPETAPPAGKLSAKHSKEKVAK